MMTTQRRKMPTEKQVRAYWSEWVLKTMGDRDESPLTLEDGTVGRLCFACGFYWPESERAHIVARCNGGTDTVENLHMLCRPCHKASEALEGSEYWEWLESWSWLEAVFVRAFLGSPSQAALRLAAFVRSEQAGGVDVVKSLVVGRVSVAGDRTRAALAARKAAGMRLGRPVELPEATRRRIVAMRADGMTLQAIVDQLTAEGVPTAKGGRWSVTSVHRVLRSMELDAEAVLATEASRG